MRHMTKKRAAQNRHYLRERGFFLATHYECEVNTPVCTSIATQVHHVVKKSQAGWLIDDRRVFSAICGECHNFVEGNSIWARENGWTFSSLHFPDYAVLEDSLQAKVDGHVWVLVDPDGEHCPWPGEAWEVREEWILALAGKIIDLDAPYDAVAHRNGDRTDNRLANLVAACPSPGQ